MSLDAKIARAEEILRGMGGAAVAFSGGVDSTVLLRLAVLVLGPKAVAVTGDSPSLPRRELDEARALARAVGARHEVLATEEIRNPSYAANPPDRCFHCKFELFDKMRAFARREGLGFLAYGELADDLGEDRPGRRAAQAFDVRWPLLEAGFTKEEVRAAARRFGLPNAEKPASPCLASRIPHFSEVTEEKLRQVERAEEAVRALGYRVFRVRHLGDRARIEIAPPELPRAEAPAAREALLTAVRAAGFAEAVVDPRGYRAPLGGNMPRIQSDGASGAARH